MLQIEKPAWRYLAALDCRVDDEADTSPDDGGCSTASGKRKRIKRTKKSSKPTLAPASSLTKTSRLAALASTTTTTAASLARTSSSSKSTRKRRGTLDDQVETGLGMTTLSPDAGSRAVSGGDRSIANGLKLAQTQAIAVAGFLADVDARQWRVCESCFSHRASFHGRGDFARELKNPSKISCLSTRMLYRGVEFFFQILFKILQNLFSKMSKCNDNFKVITLHRFIEFISSSRIHNSAGFEKKFI